MANVLPVLLNAKLVTIVPDVFNAQLDSLNKLYLWILMLQVQYTVIIVLLALQTVKHVKFNLKDVHHALMAQDYLVLDVLVCSQLFINSF